MFCLHDYHSVVEHYVSVLSNMASRSVLFHELFLDTFSIAYANFKAGNKSSVSRDIKLRCEIFLGVNLIL